MTVISIVIGAFGTVTKGLLKGLEDLEIGRRVETIQIQYYWERPEYREESWRLEETYCQSNSREKPSAKTDVKKSQGVNKKTRKQKWEGKQLYGRFKRLINNISHDKTWTWLRKGIFKRETESLLMAAQNNAIRTNHIKARIDKTQQNIKCRLCGDRDETINHIISERSKLAQEYKARHDWVGKVIHWEMWKKF